MDTCKLLLTSVRVPDLRRGDVLRTNGATVVSVEACTPWAYVVTIRTTTGVLLTPTMAGSMMQMVWGQA